MQGINLKRPRLAGQSRNALIRLIAGLAAGFFLAAHERTLGGPVAAFASWLQSPAVAKRLQELDHLALPR